MANLNLKNVVWKEGRHYVAQCLNVDVSSFGKTRREALKHLDEALALYFEDVRVPRVVNVEEPEIVRLPINHA